jgi:glycosyltransferase involved in cell wall biosynthesis
VRTLQITESDDGGGATDRREVAGSVLHISASDAAGGAARSAYRIHDTLRELGWSSRMLVGQRRTDDPDVRPLKRNVGWRAADRATGAVADALDLQYTLYPSSFGVAADPWFREADVVQLYNVHGSYFSHSALPLLSRRRPVVWRLSDQWALTGHVAYSLDCERWRHGCGSCPYLDHYPRLGRDTTALLWRWKRAVYRRSRLTVVAPSSWIARLARESPLLGGFEVHEIPNGVDLDVFEPRDRGGAKRALGLDPARSVLFFSSLERDDRRKGGRELAAALRRLADVDVQLVVAGPDSDGFGVPAHALGTVHDDSTLAAAYRAADVFALPALAENLPNTAIESLACGTPVVAFDVGGVADAVRDGETGLLARTGDVAGFAAALRRLLEDAELRARLAARARKVAVAEYDRRLEAGRFAELYGTLAHVP